jgi:hypothetical protein
MSGGYGIENVDECFIADFHETDSNQLSREACVQDTTSVDPLIVMNHNCDVYSDKTNNNVDSVTIRHS